jgi:archaellum component FlaC
LIIDFDELQYLRAENKEFKTNIQQLNEFLKDTKDHLDDKQMLVFNLEKELKSIDFEFNKLKDFSRSKRL